MATQSTAPIKPIKIEPNQIYLQVSYSPSTPSSEPPSLNINHDNLQAKYLGPIGELKGEGIYQIQSVQGQPIKRQEEIWQTNQHSIVDLVKRSEGVKSVKVMDEPKLRAKRDEF